MGEYADRLLWEKVTSFVKKEELIQRGDRILLGLSGGADSVCLARYLLAVRTSEYTSGEKGRRPLQHV